MIFCLALLSVVFATIWLLDFSPAYSPNLAPSDFSLKDLSTSPPIAPVPHGPIVALGCHLKTHCCSLGVYLQPAVRDVRSVHQSLFVLADFPQVLVAYHFHCYYNDKGVYCYHLGCHCNDHCCSNMALSAYCWNLFSTVGHSIMDVSTSVVR